MQDLPPSFILYDAPAATNPLNVAIKSSIRFSDHAMAQLIRCTNQAHVSAAGELPKRQVNIWNFWGQDLGARTALRVNCRKKKLARRGSLELRIQKQAIGDGSMFVLR